VADRAGMKVEGVGLPGHFLARHSGIFFDPFHGGNRVGLEECRALLEQQEQLLRPEHLVPPSQRQILLRMLTNLYYVSESSDPELASRLRRWMALLRR
jgi:regulator of sirC expression with transglutaminase-like and TPR domain